MDVTSLIELVLAIVVFFLALTVTKRINRLDDTITALNGENAALRKTIETLAATAKASAEEAEPKKPATPEPVAAPVVETPAPAPQAPAAQPVVTSAPAQGLTPEVVAVIMASIAAYGYSPSAIRSIRPAQALRRGQNWVMAGRLANMR